MLFKKKFFVQVDSMDLGQLADIAKMSIEAKNRNARILILTSKTIALSLAFIGFDSFIEVITK
jgi:hypothetical protein